MPNLTPSGVPHIMLDERGRAWIDDTNTKVIEVVLDKIGHGLTPEQIIEEHYGNFSLAQVYAALAYYYDHQAEFDAEIERQEREYLELREQSLDSPIRRKLRDVETSDKLELIEGGPALEDESEESQVLAGMGEDT